MSSRIRSVKSRYPPASSTTKCARSTTRGRGCDLLSGRNIAFWQSLSQSVPRATKHGVEHRLGELAGERVLLAHVVRADQQITPDTCLGGVAEHRLRLRDLDVERARRREEPVPREAAERDHDAHARQE